MTPLTNQERADLLVQKLGEAGITLVEWDVQHLIRLGVPFVDNGSRVYLVPDDDLAFIRNASAELDMVPARDADLRLDYNSHLPEKTLRFPLEENVMSKKRKAFSPMRLAFIPLSWTGIQLDELIPLDHITFEPRTPRASPRPSMPSFVKTVSIANTCAALLRIMTKVPRWAMLRCDLEADITSIISYCLFDMSYEGMYMDIPGNDVPLSDQEKADIEAAVTEIQSWKFRKDEAWLQEFLVQTVRSEKQYHELPGPESSIVESFGAFVSSMTKADINGSANEVSTRQG